MSLWALGALQMGRAELAGQLAAQLPRLLPRMGRRSLLVCAKALHDLRFRRQPVLVALYRALYGVELTTAQACFALKLLARSGVRDPVALAVSSTWRG